MKRVAELVTISAVKTSLCSPRLRCHQRGYRDRVFFRHQDLFADSLVPRS